MKCEVLSRDRRNAVSCRCRDVCQTSGGRQEASLQRSHWDEADGFDPLQVRERPADILRGMEMTGRSDGTRCDRLRRMCTTKFNTGRLREGWIDFRSRGKGPTQQVEKAWRQQRMTGKKNKQKKKHSKAAACGNLSVCVKVSFEGSPHFKQKRNKTLIKIKGFRKAILVAMGWNFTDHTVAVPPSA